MTSFPRRLLVRLFAAGAAVTVFLPLLRAGDILRGGASFGNPAARTDQANMATAAAAAAARANARDTLARTTRALRDAEAFQAAARAAARASTANHLGPNPNNPGTNLPVVPNGLGVGGLDRSPAGTWTGADLPTQSVTAGTTNVRIRQTRQTALMDWNTFNVGKRTELTFDQRAGGADVKKWVAFNKVNDPSGAPSQILGSIRADGQVYVINRNGIIFGGASQVNVASLTASSLPINDNLVSRGLLNNPDAQFLFSGLAIPAGANGTPAFTPEAPPAATGRYGAVTVQPGARIGARTDAAKSGGRVMLVGPTVTNAGTISTPDGQTILAAGLQVGIDAHPTTDPSLRGLDVFIGAAEGDSQGTTYGGTVVQRGIVRAARGNVTLAGSRITQGGIVSASTSVSFNGRIDLLASFDAIPNSAFNPVNSSRGRPFLPRATGSVAFGPDSATAILPDTSTQETLIGTELALRSQVNAIGRTVHLDENSVILATSGDVSLRAGRYNFVPGVVPTSAFVRSGGQVYLGRGAWIDVSGTPDATVSIRQHLLELELRGSEFARAPLQREGALRGVPITVDSRRQGTFNGFDWVGTPLGDATGFVGLVQRDIAEFTAPGGSVNVTAGESLVMQPGSRINVSGGFLQYEGAIVRTTRVLGRGILFDIADATPNRVYDRIYTGTTTVSSERWGVVRTYDQPLALTGEHWEPGYLHGAAGGEVHLNAASMALDGTLLGQTINGPRQRDRLAPHSSLELDFLADDLSFASVPVHSPTPPSIAFRDGSLPSVGAFATDALGNPAALRAERRATVLLRPSLFQPSGGGFGALEIVNPDGDFTLPAGQTLRTAPGGAFTLEASNVTIGGHVIAPGGDVTVTAHNLPLATLNQVNLVTRINPTGIPGRGQFTLEPGATIRTSGFLVDRRPRAGGMQPLVNDGGDISITAYTATLGRGSRVAASGGALAAQDGTVSYGDAGDISILAGRDPSLDSVIGGSLRLGGSLEAFSGSHGGTLKLAGPAFQIGGSSATPGVTVLQPAFFGTGGFAGFDLDGIGIAQPGGTDYVPGIRVQPGVRLRPVVQGRAATFSRQSDGGGLNLVPVTRPELLRDPVDLAFRSSGAIDPFANGLLLVRGEVVVGAGSSIGTDAHGKISFDGDTVTLLGSVVAPGGTIHVGGATTYPTVAGGVSDAVATVYLGREARLSVAGRTITRTGFRGNREGEVVPGGRIELSGNLLGERGSVLDASGTSGTLDLTAASLGVGTGPVTGFRGAEFRPVRIASDGGSISLQGAEMLFLDSTLRATAGGSSAIGGSLAVSSGRYIDPGTAFTTADINLQVRQSGDLLAQTAADRGVGRPLLDRTSGLTVPGLGNIVADRFRDGGFHEVKLAGNVRFLDNVDIRTSGRLSVADGGVIRSDATTRLSSAYVKLGQAFRPPLLPTDLDLRFTQTDVAGLTSEYTLPPTTGNGRLVVQADHIDVGNLVLQGIGSAHLSAPAGDIRGNGTLGIAGDLALTAGQIYPTTASRFSIFAYDSNPGTGLRPGTVTIRGGSLRPLPFSAGGTLSVQASSIDQGGTLRAPLGTISLGWDGSGTAPSNPVSGTTIPAPVTSTLTLGSRSVTSVSAIDPRTGRGVDLPYGISFDGLTWIDPTGIDVTVSGLPSKEISLAAATVTALPGSTLDVRGGGDFFAYQWIQGNGGPDDILDVDNAFAVIPGYGFDYAPFAPFNPSSAATNLQGQRGYVNPSLDIGDQITLGGAAGLPAGTYTLLPARYALLPGGFLITPLAGDPIGSRNLVDGSGIANGYRSNALDAGRSGPTVVGRFGVASGSVVRERAEYVDLRGNSFLRQAALERDFAPPRLPVDAGRVAFTATSAMQIGGSVLGSTPSGGRGSLIDVNSSSDILINATGTGGGPGVLTLRASLLNSLNASSLLVGGVRSTSSGGTSAVTVSTGNITVNNAGIPLQGNDIILAATESITLGTASEIRGVGNASPDNLLFGDEAVAGSGDGALVRVSGSPNRGSITRRGVSSSVVPFLGIGASSILEGGGVTIDSTYATDLASSARITATRAALNSGQISLRLNAPGNLNATQGLVLSGTALTSIQQSARRISLLSYSTIDLYGTGTIGGNNLESLDLQANAIRGFNTGTTGSVRFTADRISLGNASGRTVSPLATNPLRGTLSFQANEIVLGDHELRIERFAQTGLSASSRIVGDGVGSLSAADALTLTAPVLTGTSASDTAITATGALRFTAAPGTATAAGLGARLALSGGSVEVNSAIDLPGGNLSLRATSGNVSVGNLSSARFNLAGTSRTFVDVIRHTSGGNVTIASSTGSVILGTGSSIDVSSPGADAGSLNVETPNGTFTLSGSLDGGAASGFRTGQFRLDAASVSGNNLAATDTRLNDGGFTAARDYRIRTGNLTIGGTARSSVYRVAVDAGSLTVSGTIDASGSTGGDIELSSHGSLVLTPSARLDASGDTFDAAGKGGSVFLAAGSSRNGVVDPAARLNLQTGSRIDLSVAAGTPGSAAEGKFTGTLHLRAPQVAGTYQDLQMEAIGSTISGASSILVEGYRLYDLTASGGSLSTAVRNSIQTDGNAYFGAGNANYTAMLNRLTSLQPGMDLILAPGAEIINQTGDLTLGSTGAAATSNWNLATYRFGPRSAPGVLTMRAYGSLRFFNSLSDGFADSSVGGNNQTASEFWLSPLANNNPNLPDNTESWSFRLTAGADLASASFRSVQDTSALGASAGMLELGRNTGGATVTGGNNALSASLVPNNFQVIRTGSGSIDVHAGRSVRLLNPFASIYTAGTQVADPNSVRAANDFVVPILTSSVGQGALGAVQQTYIAQYSMAGGNLSIQAGQNLERLTANNSGLIEDSSRQLPNNWLHRRGHVGPDGTFGEVAMGSGFLTFTDPAASTTWWVNFSNFFQSSGALGGGNVSLTAGQDVRNFDAVIPTNARAPRGPAASADLLELGGGDLSVRAGNDLSAGVYYVERGTGNLRAGRDITTNATRSPSLGIIQNLNDPDSARFDESTWMPTALFLGKSSFDVTAGGDILLGPMANPFLMPQGLNNQFWYKTYFSTYAADSAVRITSLGGDVTLRNEVTLPDRTSSSDILRTWLERQNLLSTAASGAAFTQPWLRLAETSVQPFESLLRLRPPTLEASALDGDINLVGASTLAPSPTGQLELVANGNITGLQPTGFSNVSVPGQSTRIWTAAQINVSDANPASLPSALAPFSFFSVGGSSVNANNATSSSFLQGIDGVLNDSGSTAGAFGVAQTKLALHDPSILHRADPEPLRIYALDGNLTGLTLFSPKPSRIHASNDITDIAFYLQNVAALQTTTVTAGRDIVPFNANTAFRAAAVAPGNNLSLNELPLPGDIHLGGPGTLQILAGRDIDLGLGTTNADGTGSGILTLGNIRNLSLPFAGADIVLGAGIGSATRLADSRLNLQRFIDEFVSTPAGAARLRELGITDFASLDSERQAQVALDVFYLVLRDTGRNFNNPRSPGFGNYVSGFAAIDALFGTVDAEAGSIRAQTRNIRTRTGGDISVFAPNGGLELASNLVGNNLVPPGIVTETGGRVSIFTHDSVDIGVGRIFTLRGGDMVIWSSAGDIAAGVASKTVQSAPPTRVIFDPQSAAVETDLAGLATGGGIGVLATVAGVKPGNVDLIAPTGIIDAGDAGIRVTGNINLAATQVLNASNIAVGGTSAGAPATPVVAAPNIGGLTAASNASAAGSTAAAAATEASRQQAAQTPTTEAAPSVFTVEVLGYGGGAAPEEEEEER